jgi:hypothetical protein
MANEVRSVLRQKKSGGSERRLRRQRVLSPQVCVNLATSSLVVKPNRNGSYKCVAL